MLRVGLTGGTGAGKSTAARRLAELGAVVVDADALAREVLAPGTDGLAAVVEEFGDAVLAPDGSLDRAALAAVVFADTARRRVLEGITHPRIADLTRERMEAAPSDAVVVHDVPLLVEKAMGDRYHLVVVVDAPEDERVRRLVGRGLAEDDARRRIASQAGAEEREAAADVLLRNDGEPDALLAAVDALWAERLRPYERNVRERRVGRRPDQVVEPDPTWPARAARLGARVARAAGERGRGVEPVGPALLQLEVDSLADADALVDSLADAGFPRHDGEQPEDERLHGSADPARPVDLHVREVVSPASRTRWRPPSS